MFFFSWPAFLQHGPNAEAVSNLLAEAINYLSGTRQDIIKVCKEHGDAPAEVPSAVIISI